MTHIHSSGLNKAVELEIEKLASIIERDITPENIKYFPREMLEESISIIKARYQYLDESVINGFEMRKINRIIDYLSSRMVETKVQQDILTLPSASERHVIDIVVPALFNGRNSFSQISFPNKGANTFSLMKTYLELKSESGVRYQNSKYLMGYRVIPNESTIKIMLDGFVNTESESGDRSSKETSFRYLPSIEVNTLFWRYK